MKEIKPKSKNIKNIKNNQNKISDKKNTYVDSKIQTSKIIGEVWNLEPILAGKTFDEWIKVINSKVDTFKKYRNILNDKISSEKVLEILKLEEEISTNTAQVDAYYELKFYEDTTNPDALAKLGQLKQIGAEINNNLIYFNIWFMHLNDKSANKLLLSKELQDYRYHLELIRKAKPYTKSEEMEQIIQLKDITGGAYSELYTIITDNYTFDWSGTKISKEEIIKYCFSEDSKLREKAYELILKRYKEDGTVLLEIYKNVVTDWCNDGVKIRGHINSINVRNISYDVSDKAVDALLKVVRKNVPLFIEYFKVKYALNKKAGQKYSYSRYHLYAPFITKSKKSYDYESSKTYVLDTYKQFDSRFYDRAMTIFKEKHVHSHPTKTKHGGAFCLSVTKGIIPYILLNHTNTLRDVFTIIHELGHGIHDILAGEKQKDLERHASVTICETASTFGEMLLAERLLSESNDIEEKKRILVQSMDNQWATIIRQSYFVIFEKYAHEQIPKGITREALDNYYYELLKEQFGDMQIPEVFKHEWSYISHIYEMPFYCYSYAWGNLFVLALYDMYRQEGKSFIEKYVELLSAGGSDSPANLMKKLGVDPESEEFWQRGFNIIRLEMEELKKIAK